MTWLEQVRRSLHRHRQANRPFEQAWGYTMADHPADDEWIPVREFVRKHMRAAYYNDDSSMGRLRAMVPDVSEGSSDRGMVAA